MAEVLTSRSRSREPRVLAGVFAAALVLYVFTAWLIAQRAGMPFLRLGAFFDAALYIEIAKSFPLPYAPEGRDYLGQAPGYPAVMALLRALTPRALLHWGALALAASWLPAALATAAFWVLCRDLEIEPLWPSVAFAAANPRWLTVASTVHAESLAMLLLLVAAVAHGRGRLGWAVGALAAAGLARFPALLVGAAFAYGVLVQQRRRDLRAIGLLCVPVLAFGLWNLYLFARIPGFAGIAEAHSVFWETGPSWPFEAIAANARRWWSGEGAVPGFALTNLTLAFLLASLAFAARSSERELRFLGVWVAAIVAFHVCLSGEWGGFDFARLTLLAWPAALLIVWKRVLSMRTIHFRAAVCTLAAAASLATAVRVASDAVRWQWASYPTPAHTAQGYRIDTPRWIDFRALYDPPAASGRERRRGPHR